MASRPQLSIITVTWNAAEFIEPTIRSIAAQRFTDREYIIVDGLSADGTIDIIKRHPDTVTKWISERDKGLYDAMNKAIALAEGQYLMFLNAGDLFYDEESLNKAFAGAAGQDVIYADTAIINSQYELVGMRHLTPPEQLSWKSFRKGMVVCHQAILAKKEIVPLYDTRYRVAADIDWAIRLTKNMKSSYFYHPPLIRFMQGGISTKHRFRGLKERFKVMVKHFGLFPTLYQNLVLGIRYLLSLRFIHNVRK